MSEGRSPDLLSPAQVAGGLLQFLPWGEVVPLTAIASALGSRDKSHPLRPIQKHIQTAGLFGLVRVEGDGLVLTYRGYCVQRGGAAGVTGMRAAFTVEELPRRVAAHLAVSSTVSTDGASQRLAALAEAHNLWAWVEWLQAAGMLVDEGGSYSMAAPYAPLCIDAFDESTYRAMERELYVRLLPDSPASGNADGELGLSRLQALVGEFRKARDDDAEGAMLRVLQIAFRTLGFEVQCTNGARERVQPGVTHLHFGPKGDDLAALFLRAPIALAESLDGWVIAVEAKAGGAPKKAVTQARAFADRVEKAFGGRVAAMPVAISGRPMYPDELAKRYGRDTSVVHVPLEALVKLAEQQWVRHRDHEAALITAPALLSFLQHAGAVGYVEPATDDLVLRVGEIAERRSAAWLSEADPSE